MKPSSDRAMSMPDFCRWIIDHRTDHPEVADLIATARSDPDFPVNGSGAMVRNYLQRRGANTTMLTALNEAIEMWKDEASYPRFIRDSALRQSLHAHRGYVYSGITLVIVVTALIPGPVGTWMMTGALVLIILPLLLGI